MKRLLNIDLSNYHTLAAPANARELLIIEDRSELHELNKDDIFLGSGSNIIFKEQVNSRLVKLNFADLEIHETENHFFLKVESNFTWKNLVEWTINNGIFGLENLAAIYGTVGAAPVQNIGAYGVELADFISEIEVYDCENKQFLKLKNQEALFSYRHSIFKTKKSYLVLSITLRLNKKEALNKSYGELKNSTAKNSQELMREIINLRSKKIPNPEQFPNAGSFFHNPIVTSEKLNKLKTDFPDLVFFPYEDKYKIAAAWCIEKCGLKGYQQGKVAISEQHSLILVNNGGTGEEILNFASFIQQEIARKFALNLQIEPTIIS